MKLSEIVAYRNQLRSIDHTDQVSGALGYFNEVVFSSDATHFLETDLPYFIGNDQQDVDDLDKNAVISFQQMQELSIKKPMGQIKKN